MTPLTRLVSVLLLIALAVLVIVTTFLPYPPAIEAARAAEFSDDQIQTGLQFAFERRLFMWTGVTLEWGLLSLFALTSSGRWLADRVLAWTGQRRVLASLGIGGAIAVLHTLVYVPLGIARLEHMRAWGMTEQGLDGWLRDYALSSAISLIGGAIVVAGFYTLLIWLPRVWWVVAPFGAGGLAIAFALLSPIVVNPLFNDFTPLAESKWKDLEPRVQALIREAEVPVAEILVMNASRQGNHSNAYFTGFGPTRRIVLYDTLLTNHKDLDEVDSILAHEIGHWQHDHINKGILLGMLASLVGCYVLQRALQLAQGRPPWNLQSLADPAGLPLVLLLVNLGSWVAMPVSNVVSRHFERQADQTSLRLADVPEAFIAAERNLARVNKGNVAPTPWNVWLFSTHPTVVERIRMAEDWRKQN